MSNVAVYVRFRPANSKESSHGTSVVPPESADHQSFALKDDNYGEITFSFDKIFYKDCSQAEFYDAVALPIVQDVMNAVNGTILAYGQTGAGKTYTMEGPNMLTDSAEMRGILPRVAHSIFEFIAASNATSEFIIRLSMVEIYKEKIRDLFDATKDNLQVKEDKEHGIFVAGATETYVQSEDEMVQLLEAGITNRASGTTQMNARSSRSHCVSMLTIQQIDTNDDSTCTGKLYLVDLAGSEKVEKTGVEGAVLEEAKMINKSLSALGNVINALTTDKAAHVPYRDSKLTRILQESLGGNSRTTLLCCCSPSSLNYTETLSTLRFGARAKQIKNKPRINAQPGRNDLERQLKKSRQEYEELLSQFLLLNARLGVSAEGATLVKDPPILSSSQDVPNCCFYQGFGKSEPPSRDGISLKAKDVLIAGGMIPSGSTSEVECANHVTLQDLVESKLTSLHDQNLSLSSADANHMTLEDFDESKATSLYDQNVSSISSADATDMMLEGFEASKLTSLYNENVSSLSVTDVNDMMLGSFESNLTSEYDQKWPLSSIDAHSDTRFVNESVGRALHLLKNAVVDLGRKCEKLLQGNEELKMEMIAFKREIAHFRSADSQEMGASRPGFFQPIQWAKNGMSWGASRKEDSIQNTSGAEDRFYKRIPMWALLCRIAARTARPHLSPLSL